MRAQASKATGALTLQKLLDMKDAGVEVSSFVSEELRANLYLQEVQARPRGILEKEDLSRG